MSAPIHSLFEKTARLFGAAETQLRADAIGQAEPLFRWTLGHILLGRQPEGAEDWLAAQLAGFAFTDNRKADVRRWTHLLATAAALGHSVTAQALAGCRWLGATGESPEYALAQYGLALCGAGACTDRSAEWFAKLLAIPHDPEVAHIAFDLLFVCRALDNRCAAREATVTDIVARTFAESLWFTQPYSAAAHVCAWARSAPDQPTPAAPLFDRLAAIDARNLDASRRPTIAFSPVELAVRPESDSAERATILATVTAQGEGVIDPGLHELRAFASELPEWLAQTVQDADFTRRTASGGRQRVVVACVLKRSRSVELSEAASADIALRLDLAIAIANRRWSPLAFEARFVSETPG